MVVNRCARSTSRSFIAEQVRGGDSFQEQDCLSWRCQVIITNSPYTGLSEDFICVVAANQVTVIT